MGIVALPTFGSDPVTITAAGLDGKVDPLATEFNGSIDNDNIKASAGIVYSKLTLTGGIVNADISASAAIAASKIDLGTIAQDINEAKGADVASATTTNIWVTDGNFIHITGTTTITSFGTAPQAGAERTVVFDGALTLTHNATSLILPGGANITTVAGDRAIVRAETTANARVISYIRAAGTPLVGLAASGSVVQMVNHTYTTSTTGTTAIPNDDTIPQITEGDQYLTKSITPTSASNYLRIDVVLFGTETSDTADILTVALFQDATANALACGCIAMPTVIVAPRCVAFTYWMTAGTASSTTFTVRAGMNTGTFRVNGGSTGRVMGGVLTSSLTITEIKA